MNGNKESLPDRVDRIAAMVDELAALLMQFGHAADAVVTRCAADLSAVRTNLSACQDDLVALRERDAERMADARDVAEEQAVGGHDAI